MFGLMNLVDFSIISAALGVLAGVINSIFASRRAEKQRQTEIETRQAQLFMELYNRFSEEDFYKKHLTVRHLYTWTDYNDFIEKYWLENNLEDYSKISSLLMYYSGIGVLVERKLIDIKMVSDIMGPSIYRIWEKYEPMILEHRKNRNDPWLWEHFEYLYNEVKPLAFKLTKFPSETHGA